MSKILYKTGQQVAFRSKRVPMRYQVIGYRKGDSEPYILQSVKYPEKGTTRANVTQIISWDNHPYNKRKDDDVQVATKASTPAPVKGITQDEVSNIVAKEVACVEARIVVMLQEAISNLHDHALNDAETIARDVVEEHIILDENA
jgi:hypothetical protein